MFNDQKLIEWIFAKGVILAIAVFLLGAIILFWASASAKEALVNIGATLLTTSLLYIIFNLTTIAISTSTEHLVIQSGLRKIFNGRADLEASYDHYSDLIREAKKDFIAVGATLDDLLKHPQAIDELRSFVSRGGQIKLLMMSESSKFLKQRGIEQDRDSKRIVGKLTDSISNIKAFLTDLKNRNLQAQVEIRTYDKMPVHSILIIDRYKLEVMSYPYGRSDAPWMEFIAGPKSLFNHYYQSYLDLWGAGQPIHLL